MTASRDASTTRSATTKDRHPDPRPADDHAVDVRTVEARKQPTPARASHGLPFGVRYTPDGCAFSVEANAEKLRVRLVNPMTREARSVEMSPTGEGDPATGVEVWTAEVEGALRGWSYAFELERDGRQLADILDPWATLVRGDRAYIEAEDSAVNDRPSLDPADAILYELHVRDFTRRRSSGVPSDERGRYPGLARRGTVIPGTDLTSGLDHILELGVTVVQIMPVHSFAMPYNPSYEWGYMPNDFNAPHASYALGVDVEAPIRELKHLVNALHDAGLRVTLDVVYNHTAEGWPSKLRNMMALAPKAYYRWRDDGTPWNGSGCGNEFASETDTGRRFIRESTKYWINRFGVDGFRFDLMGLIDDTTMQLVADDLHAIDPTILVYGEPWPGGETPIDVNSKGKQRGKRWGVFNDDMRDGLRGRVFKSDDLGFLTGGTDTHAVKDGILGGTRTFAEQPTETINYIECHDNHTLMDRIALTGEAAKIRGLSEDDMTRMSALGVLILMTSQGVPFVHSGQEFGRRKGGHDNTYNLGDDINNVSWEMKKKNHRLFRHYRDAVKLRREHPMFRLDSPEKIRESIAFLDDDLHMKIPIGTVGFRITDPTGDDPWSAALCLFNGTGDQVEMPIPKGRWRTDMIDGRFDRLTRDGEELTGKTVTIERFSGLIAYTPRTD